MSTGTDLIVNDLLCALKCNFSKHPRSDLCTILADFYSENEIEAAKSTLCDVAEKCVPKPDAELKKIVVRKGDGKIKRDIEDISNIYTALDNKKCAIPLFVAGDATRLPTFKDFEVS